MNKIITLKKRKKKPCSFISISEVQMTIKLNKNESGISLSAGSSACELNAQNIMLEINDYNTS